MNSKQRSENGFTIVELLVVIVVIGILAAITIVAFNGVQNRAVATTMQADLDNIAKQLRLYEVNAGTYPATKSDVAATINDGAGPKLSPGNEYQYTYAAASNSFCVTVTSTKVTTLSFRYDSLTNKTEEGVCAGHVAAGGGSTGPVFSENGAVVTVLAGSTSGYQDGTGTVARFVSPHGINVDRDNNVYVAELGGNRVRKITPAGVVTTVAGSITGASGFVNGAAADARFNGPSGVAVDSTGNIYVSDLSNHAIRKITPSGQVETFAGSGVAGGASGQGVAAQFRYPYGIAIDASDNVYVADSGNHRIQKITPSGLVTTFVGSSTGSNSGTTDATGTAARFNGPQVLTFGPNGDLYIGDYANHRVRIATPAGVVRTYVGSSSGYVEGIGTAARFYYVQGIAVDPNGIVYVADGNNSRIRKVVPSGAFGETSPFVGTGSNGSADGTGTDASFRFVRQMTMDSTGTIYFVDQGNTLIRKIR